MKRFLSLLLVGVLLFSNAVTVFAGNEQISNSFENFQDEGLPLILVSGMDMDALTVDPDDGSARPALSIDSGEVMTAVWDALRAGIFSFNTEKTIDSLLEYANDVGKYIASDKNGEPLYPSNAKTYPFALSEYPEFLDGSVSLGEADIVLAAAERFGAERTYYFTYDWRRNPLDISDDLSEMVDLALQNSGAEKVNIVCASLGGIETLAYLTEYGYEKVNSCVFLSSAFYGAYMPSDMMCGRVVLDADALSNFILHQMNDNMMGSFFVKALKSIGVFNLISFYANRQIEKHMDKIAEEFLLDTLGYLLPFWALMLPEDYEAAIESVFGHDIEGNADFIALTAELQGMILGRDELLQNAAQDGVAISVVSGYNSPAILGYARSGENSDGVLDTALMAGGAVVAPFGKTLGEDYVAENSARLSPDSVVDASGCLFPEHTWFVKDGPHVGGKTGSDYADFILWLAGFEGQPTVDSNPFYPQFLKTDGQQQLFPLD